MEGNETSTELVPTYDLNTVALPPALASIRQSIAAAVDDIEALAEAGDIDTLLVGVAVLDTIRKDLAALRSTAGVAAAEHMPDKMYALEGVGLFERKVPSKRATDWDAILNAVRQRAIADPDTGELADNPVAAVDKALDLIRAIVPLYKSTNAKQAGLTGAGIDKDDVQDTEWRAPDVTFRPTKP
jgi:hypothetical protein